MKVNYLINTRCMKVLGLATLIALSLGAYFASAYMIPSVKAIASYSGAAKPMEFYFHYVDTPVHVAGMDTKYIMNTTKWFSFSTQQEAHANSFYKSIGQPKIAVDFYLYPNLAGPVVIDGLWQVFIWANGSAYKPTGFNIMRARGRMPDRWRRSLTPSFPASYSSMS